MNKSFVVKKMVKNPVSGKRTDDLKVQVNNSIEVFRWNTVYHVYNSTKTYSQLQKTQLKDVIWV